MKLELTRILESPVSAKDEAIWVSEKEGSFFITDRWKICRLKINESLLAVETLLEASEESAYSMKGIYDKRLPDSLFEEISEQGIKGFRLLTKSEYDAMDTHAGSNSYLEMVNRYGIIDQYLPLLAKNKRVILFGKKSISIGEFRESALHIADTVKTKGKAPVDAYLHPTINLIVYTTNYGEIYGQYFESKSFGKCYKVDALQKPCYQIGFTLDGNRLVVCGLGFVKIYDYQNSGYLKTAEIAISARSFEIQDNYLIINKGLHGIDVFLIKDTPERVCSLEMPFAIDRLVACKSRRKLLLTSNPFGKVGLAEFFD